MYITWYGQGCFKLTAKHNGEDVSLVTDPFDSTAKNKLTRVTADLVSVTKSDAHHANISQVKGAQSDTPFVITIPGEYEAKGIFVTGIATDGEHSYYRYDIDSLALLHIGKVLDGGFTDKQLELIGTIDVLILPVDHKDAQKVINVLEPRIVIPAFYDLNKAGLTKAEVETFAQGIGSAVEEVKQKWRLTRKDLPQDQTKVMYSNG